MKFSTKDFCSKCDQIRSFLRIWSHLLKKSLMENFIFCAVVVKTGACQIYVNNNAIVTETEIKSDREAYSEPCQKSKMERFAKITANYFRKTRHITCLAGFWIHHWVIPQPVSITCSKLTIETLEQGVNYVQS